ncbi:hypothetical protein D3C72_2101000 [compost metagenome]
MCSETELGNPMTIKAAHQPDITVFPNPSQGIINLPEGEKVSYINDLQGRTIGWTQVGTKVRLTGVAPGSYIVHTVSGKQVRIVIVK